MDISVKIDTSGLNRALELAQQFTKRTPAQAVNTAAYWIAVNTKNRMPYASMEKMDTDFALATPLVGKKRGQGFRKGIKFQRENRVVGDIAGRDVPLAVLIIQARARAGSNYNRSTNNRYALSQSPFKGVSPQQGRALMGAAITRMINARHSSIKFLLATWIPIIQTLLQYTVNKYQRGSSSGPPLEGAKSFHGADLGNATPAKEGSVNAVAIIENLIGLEGENADSFNQAMWKYGAPILQDEVNNEGARNMQYFLDRAGKEELEIPFNRLAS